MEELLEILGDLHPEVDFTEQKGLVDHHILDSFDIVTLVSEINEAFEVLISADEILPEHFNSATALYELIQSKMEDDD